MFERALNAFWILLGAAAAASSCHARPKYHSMAQRALFALAEASAVIALHNTSPAAVFRPDAAYQAADQRAKSHMK
jgi:hypothetical protein